MAVGFTDYMNYGYDSSSNVRTFASSKSKTQQRDGTENEDTTTGETAGSGEIIDAVFGDPKDKNVSMEDFLTLMIAQLKNQDFMNPADDTQYVTQLAQISTMQQMEEMSYNAKSTYIASLVGKNVVAAKFTVSGDLKKTEGIVNKISLLDGDFVIYVDGESYTMDEIMEIKTAAAGTTPEKPDETEKPDGTEKPGEEEKPEGTDKPEEPK